MPSCEILSIGTELLLGQITNTNSQFLAEELAAIGINCYFQTTCGDNTQRIIGSIKEALRRADILLITGGLGPTKDDLTTEALALAFGAQLVFDEKVMQRIEHMFQTRGFPMPESNRKQALRPAGSQILPNGNGTAPGIIWELDAEALTRAQITPSAATCVVMTFPGVPSEMKSMWRQTAVPYLTAKYGNNSLWSVDLKHYGIGESALAEKYSHLLDLTNPTVAPYAGSGECKLRVSARASTLEEAQRETQPVIDEIVKGSGDLLYGRNDDTLEVVLGRLLKEAGFTVAVAESCTGGLVSKRLTDVPGSSAYVRLNTVTYANEMKEQILKVPQEILLNQGAVSQACAEAMARGIKKLAGCDLSLSVTGIAGPEGGTEEKPVGLVYVCLLDKNDRATVKKLTYPSHLSRQEIRQRTASEALNMVRLYLLKKWKW